MSDESSSLKQLLLRVHVWWFATLVPLLVRFVPLERLVRLLSPPLRLRPYPGVGASRVVEIVDRRLRNPRNMRRRACLRHGLTLFHFLRLTGARPVIHFAVHQQTPANLRLHAHCWVTLNGEPLSDPPAEDYTTLFTHG